MRLSGDHAASHCRGLECFSSPRLAALRLLLPLPALLLLLLLLLPPLLLLLLLLLQLPLLLLPHLLPQPLLLPLLATARGAPAPAAFAAAAVVAGTHEGPSRSTCACLALRELSGAA